MGSMARFSLLTSLTSTASQSSYLLKPYMLCSSFHTQSTPLLFYKTHLLWAEPMKKKKRIDPGIIAAREAKKIKRIEKEIRRLTKFGRILKPVDEIELDNRKLKLANERKRSPLVPSLERDESRAALTKKWGFHKTKQWHFEYKLCEQIMSAQFEALQELKAVSQDLYQSALLVDYSFIPIEFQGPKESPAFKDYSVPDGEYVDTTRKY
ncbi:large ribosomal subunit protein mL40-like [Physella acuta]|uniref:large ribosomal subunit protein mL40-like n=1 Tax=Physella acuta TaxID=109671 RepID=UPI0027DDED59|nr:large ribosomal subunit protein mL40-like [Physella acuta]